MYGYKTLSLLLACTTFASAADVPPPINKYPTLSPKVYDLPPQFHSFVSTSKRVKALYGPFNLTSKLTPTPASIATKEIGLTALYFDIILPCKTCYLIAASGSAEYENGTIADLNTGISLHHFTTDVYGKGRHRTPCTSQSSEILFTFGNERTPTVFSDIVDKRYMSAFPISENETFPVRLALQNFNDKDVQVYTTLAVEYVEGAMPKDWLRQRSIWLDNGNCTQYPAVPVPKDTTKFYLQSQKWVAEFDGELLGAGGHIHSGGHLVEIYQNEKVVCASKAVYEQKAAGDGMGHSMRSRRDEEGAMVKRHEPDKAKEGSWFIKSMTTCSNMGKVKKGDVFYKKSHYDLEKYYGMKNPDGSWMEVEGVAVISVALEQGGK